ncbi:uncharacterized protein LOC129586360 [Paramacrobiotus metropolitanus]|uniref:uncharacterized protein LOC129586360 n=1 Tax=Paramacrobiotus metropolitanus TaxID=2943436 RepID=UPI002445D3B8|nr:uncharacterized protein LOC129586360 [Paramacrobiotus metropolitanus]
MRMKQSCLNEFYSQPSYVSLKSLSVEINMNTASQNCVIPALVWYPPALINESPVGSSNKEDTVPLVSFSYRIDATYQATYPHSVQSRPSVIEERKAGVKKRNVEGSHEKAFAPGSKVSSASVTSTSGNLPAVKDPFSPECLIPIPKLHGDHLLYYEPVFLRRRNERERQRVRCVNDGYTRLRQKLPTESSQKRMSKVDILRGAIKYIRHLQILLDSPDSVGCRPVTEKIHTSIRGSRPG